MEGCSSGSGCQAAPDVPAAPEADELPKGRCRFQSCDVCRQGLQELQDVLREDWAHFREVLEAHLEDQLRRQARRIDDMVASSDGGLGAAAAGPGQHLQANAQAVLPDVHFDLGAVSPPETSPQRNMPSTLVVEDGNGQSGPRQFQTKRSFSDGSTQDKDSIFLRQNGAQPHEWKQDSTYTLWDQGPERTIVGKATYERIARWMNWYLTLEEPPPRGRLARIVGGKAFETLCACVIAANSAMTVYTTNLEADTLVQEESFVVQMINGGFVAFYCIELAMKLTVHRAYFFINTDMYWNLLDLVLVVLALYDVVSSAIFATSGTGLTHMRTMRVFRLAKILRVVRVMRFFQELRLILNSVLGSIVALFWSITMLMLVFFVFSLVFVQGATSARQNNAPGIDLDSLERYLGSVQAGMLMLYSATTGGDDWSNYYRSIEYTGDLNCAFFLFFVAFAHLALLNILTGIFVENAMKLAQPDRDTLALHKRKEETQEADELRRLCKAMDRDNTGYILQTIFMEHLRSSRLKARLAVLGLDIKDAELFFNMIATDFDYHKQVEIEAFVSGCMRLKGLASSLDLQAVMFGTKLIHANQIKFNECLEAKLNEVLDRLSKKP